MSPLATALIATGALLFGSYGVGQVTGLDPTCMMIVISAVWAGWDASRIGLGKYKTGLGSPTAAFIGVLLLWIVGFPWYLVVRQKIAAGQVPLKDGTLPAAPTAGAQAGAPATADTKACPKCAESVKAAAQVCRYCSHSFEAV